MYGLPHSLASFVFFVCSLSYCPLVCTYVDARISAAELLHARSMKLSIDCSMRRHAADLCGSVNLRD